MARVRFAYQDRYQSEYPPEWDLPEREDEPEELNFEPDDYTEEQELSPYDDDYERFIEARRKNLYGGDYE